MASSGPQQHSRSPAAAITSRLNASAEAATGNAAAAARWAGRFDDDEGATMVPRPSSAAPAGRFDVFINHRGVDTKHNVASLLYEKLEQLSGGRVRSFLDSKSMSPGDRLHECINEGIRQCKVGVIIFSKRYFDSEFCLQELTSIVEGRKVLIPIFYGIKPSELILPQAVLDSTNHTARDIERYRLALHEAKYTVGITYDPATDNVVKLVKKAAKAVMRRIEEIDQSVPQRQMLFSRL
ncbi:hypothetical protein BS78_02G318500 [Paspalum vaginatum]|nr:hypothetical protein BS78_02G318500 [Paspalum vaginatum]